MGIEIAQSGCVVAANDPDPRDVFMNGRQDQLREQSDSLFVHLSSSTAMNED